MEFRIWIRECGLIVLPFSLPPKTQKWAEKRKTVTKSNRSSSSSSDCFLGGAAKKREMAPVLLPFLVCLQLGGNELVPPPPPLPSPPPPGSKSLFQDPDRFRTVERAVAILDTLGRTIFRVFFLFWLTTFASCFSLSFGHFKQEVEVGK